MTSKKKTFYFFSTYYHLNSIPIVGLKFYLIYLEQCLSATLISVIQLEQGIKNIFVNENMR